MRPVLARQEGRIASRHERGSGCDGRRQHRARELVRTNGAAADGEVVWSWCPDAGTKSCGTIRAATGARKPGSPGRVRRKPLKPSRRECRMIWLNLWCLPPAFLIAGGPWVRPSPGIPCALLQFRGARMTQNSGEPRRESADSCFERCEPHAQSSSPAPGVGAKRRPRAGSSR